MYSIQANAERDLQANVECTRTPRLTSKCRKCKGPTRKCTGTKEGTTSKCTQCESCVVGNGKVQFQKEKVHPTAVNL